MISRFQISRGMEITDERIDTLLDESQYQLILEKTIELLSYRDHSRFDLQQKLRQRNFKAAVIEKALDYAASKGYINDEKYAPRFAVFLQSEKKYGPRMIWRKMLEKGLAKDLIENALQALDETIHLENCRTHFRKKAKRLHRGENEEDRQKIIAFLEQKGFEWEQIMKVLDEDE